MIRIVILLFLTIPLLFSQACAQNKPYVSPEGGFSIDLPSTPSEVKDAQLAVIGGKKLGWKNDKASFTVSYADTPGASSANAESIVMGSADAYIAAMPKSADNIVKNKVSLEGHPGVEVKSREKDGFTVMTRYYVVDKRLYCVVAMWMGGPNDNYAIRTINSFKVLNPAAFQ